MKKEEYILEYIFDKASRQSLWSRIATPEGLSDWFAEEVNYVNDKILAFTWNKYVAEAEIIGINPNSYIRFRWVEEEDLSAFFEFKLERIELTGGLMLQITDFVEPGDKEKAIALWNSEVGVLRRVLGL